MIDFLKSWIFNIVTLVIFIVLLEILLPTGKMKKFINLVSGFVLIIAIINPFLVFARNGVDMKDFQLSAGNFLDRREITANSKYMEDKQMQQVVEVYRKKLINTLEEGLKGMGNTGSIKADVLIDEDYESGSFGEIKRVLLTLSMKDEALDVKPVSKIDRIQIGDRNKQPLNEKTDPGNEMDKDLKNKIEEKVNRLLDVKKENIVITLLDK